MIYVISQTALLYGVNAFSSISWCALCFTLAALNALYIAQKQSPKRAAMIHGISTSLCLFATFGKVYMIKGVPFDALHTASYLSMFCAMMVALFIFAKQQGHNFFGKALFATLLAGLSDCLIMGCYFLPRVSFSRTAEIFCKELGWKSACTIAILSGIYAYNALSKGTAIEKKYSQNI